MTCTTRRATGRRTRGDVLRALAGPWAWLSIALVAGACGRVPLDQAAGSEGTAARGGGGDVGGSGVAGSGAMSGGAAGTGAAGASGRIPTQHRPAGASCPPRDVPDNLCAFPQPGPGGRVPGACYSDADCTEGGQRGRCVSLAGMTACQCAYDQCFRDSDCRDGGACFCQSILSGNACLGGGCRDDGDCGGAGFCSLSANECGGLGTFQCHTPNDTCIDDVDCMSPQFCGFDSTRGAWRCMYPAVCI